MWGIKNKMFSLNANIRKTMFIVALLMALLMMFTHFFGYHLLAISLVLVYLTTLGERFRVKQGIKVNNSGGFISNLIEVPQEEEISGIELVNDISNILILITGAIVYFYYGMVISLFTILITFLIKVLFIKWKKSRNKQGVLCEQ